MTMLVVVSCGPGTSIQDRGRFGYQRFGLGPAGAMDRVAMAQANILVGNEPDAAAIEMAVLGAKFKVEGGKIRLAAAGAGVQMQVDDVRVPTLTSVTADVGQVIEIGSVRSGFFMYLAVSGGFDIVPQLGSRALHSRGRVGGIDGRACKPGDRLPVTPNDVSGPELTGVGLPATASTAPIRIMLGPQDDYFTKRGLATFLGEAYTITTQTDRMGIRLSGPPIEHNEKGFNIVSDGIATGSIQVPGAGEPLVQLADRGTTGGYPKIATVISADHGRIAQLPSGTKITFGAVTRLEAINAARVQQSELLSFKDSLRPTGSMDLSSERLLALELNEGWGA